MKPTTIKFIHAALLALPLALFVPQAEAQTVSFSTAAAGVTKSIPYWGYDTAWGDQNNMRRCILFMGSENVNLVRVGAAMNDPLVGADIWSATLSDNCKQIMSDAANLTKALTPNAKWYFACGEYNDWYRNSQYRINPDRYAAGWEANVRYLKSLPNAPTFWAIDGFNEPDYAPNNEGSAADWYVSLGHLLANVEGNFAGLKMGGCGTLNCDQALSWFNPLIGRASLGSTHWLAGSMTSYINAITTFKNNNCVAAEPEVHNVGECIIGANYGLDAVVWWGPCDRARGEFVQACKGKRLGYAENRANATAAAVYRTPGGKIKAFLGGSERDYVTRNTTYTLTCTDRDVYFNGQGPQRSYTVVAGCDERVIDITWGTDHPTVINGRYKLINKNSGKALEVGASSTADGVQLQQWGYVGALNQKWDVQPLTGNGGNRDYSYYTIKAAHSGKCAEVGGLSFANGGAVNQWSYVTQANQHWYLEYAGGGYYKIRSGWNTKVLEVGGNSKVDGAKVQQWDDAGSASQLWSFQAP